MLHPCRASELTEVPRKLHVLLASGLTVRPSLRQYLDQFVGWLAPTPLLVHGSSCLLAWCRGRRSRSRTSCVGIAVSFRVDGLDTKQLLLLSSSARIRGQLRYLSSFSTNTKVN